MNLTSKSERERFLDFSEEVHFFIKDANANANDDANDDADDDGNDDDDYVWKEEVLLYKNSVSFVCVFFNNK